MVIYFVAGRAFIYGCSNNATSEKIAQTIMATFRQYYSIDELADQATLIIEGKVLNSNVKLLDSPADADDIESVQHIHTVSEIEVSKVFKGDIEEKEVIEVKQMGGETENAIRIFEQATYLEEGEAVVLFLETYKDSPASLLNPNQAQYTVDGDTLINLEDNQLELDFEKLVEINE